MFDILDNPTTLSYIQNNNSRASSSRNIQKSQYLNTSSIDSKRNNHKISLYDQNLDSLYDKQKKNHQRSPNKSNSINYSPGNKDSLNINFGQIAKSKDIPYTNNGNSRIASKMSINRNSFDDNHDNLVLNQNFGQTQHTIINPSKVQESFISTRHMRPPINRKQSFAQPLNNTVAFTFDGVILEQQATITNSSQKLKDNKRNHGNKSIRRSSIDQDSDINDAESVTNIFDTNNPNNVRFDSIKEDKFKHSTDSNYQSQKFMTTHHQNSKFYPQIKLHIEKHHDKSQNKEMIETLKKENKENLLKYEKDIKQLKEKHQEQIKYLEQSIKTKTKQNAQLRDYFIKQTNKVIDEERSRTKKVHQEEIGRMKEMLQWQKERLKSTYILQIQALKKTISFNNHFNSLQHTESNSINKHHWQTQQQLKFKAANLNQREKQIQKRENDVQFKWQELISTKRYDEQRLRQEQKRLYENQTAQKKYLMEQKRQLAQQKRQMGIQMGNLELQYFKRKEQLDIRTNELNVEAQILDKQKYQTQKMNQEMMKRHKLQTQQHMIQRERLKEIEIQLIKKIQLVELRARSQFYNTQNKTQKMPFQLKPTEQGNEPQALSMKKKLQKTKNTQSMLQINKTKQKFIQIKQSMNGKNHMTLKENKKMDLSRYMQKVNQINKTKPYY